MIILEKPCCTLFEPEASVILLDDAVTNAAMFDVYGYLHLTQSENGTRQKEVELCPQEVIRLVDFLNSPAGKRCLRRL